VRLALSIFYWAFMLWLGALLLFCSPAWGADRAWKVSLVTMAGASAADWASSLGHWESNRLASGADGRFAARRGAAIKAATFAASTAIQCKTPRHRKLWTALNFAAAGVYAGVAIRNGRVR